MVRMNDVLAHRPDARLRQEDLQEVAVQAEGFGRSVDRLLKGEEIGLPPGKEFEDYQGHKRGEMRVRWWGVTDNTYRGRALSVRDLNQLPEDELQKGAVGSPYPGDAKPVLFGHYKMKGKPTIEAHNAACLDYPTMPCAYAWREGEETLRTSSLRIIDGQ